MDISPEPTCRACGRKMVKGSPGLRAFLCEACGAVDSNLTHSAIQQMDLATRPEAVADSTSRGRP